MIAFALSDTGSLAETLKRPIFGLTVKTVAVLNEGTLPDSHDLV